MLFAMVACTLVGFASDNNQSLVCATCSSVEDTDMPRRRMLLGAGNTNRKAYTYYGSSSSNSGNTNTTRIFVDDPPDIVVDSVKIIMRLHWSDIDSPDFVPRSTTPAVSFNGVSIGYLTKLNSKTENDVFTIDPSLVKFGDYNTLWHETSVNNTGSGSWASITIEGVVKTIDLKASQNYDDRIQLTWNASSGLSGARYFIDRRQNPDKPFKCLNENKPILGSRYDDMDASAGGNYYYRVRSESGVMSEQVTGKRVAKTVEPKFQFALTGTVRPDPVGASGEEDVLVAGHVFYCNVSVVEPSQNVIIKKIELVGRNVGGAASRKDHKIVWESNNESLSYWSYLNNWVRGQTRPGGNNGNNSVDFMAVLKTGKGYHGNYSWKIAKCEYEINGKTGNKTFDGPSKPVYFDKYGIDNGVKVDREYWNPSKKNDDGTYGGWEKNTFCEKGIIPNWYTYWKEDGACPSLNNSDVSYRGKYLDGGGKSGGESGPNRFFGSYVYIDKHAAELWYYNENILNPLKTILHDLNLSAYLFGIYKVEDVVAHEIRHNKTRTRYKSQIRVNSQGIIENDKDREDQMCIINTGGSGTDAPCKNYGSEYEKRTKCDNIVDEDEINGIDVSGVIVNCLDWEKVDTFNLRVNKGWAYGGYGDNEMLSLVAGRLGTNNAKPDYDWAYPGVLAGGPHSDVKPSYHSSRMVTAKQNLALRTLDTSFNEQTNLVISINSVWASALKAQNIVTGIVYKIGVAIEGDELVEFNGYLFDAQSNTIATAISAASVESDSVALFFDARDIFENSNGGPYTLGKVELTVDDNYSTNNVIGVLYDFAVDPIELDKDELLCNKGHILGTVINEQSETGIVATVSTKINIADAYQVSVELVNTNDELVAFTLVSNLCVVGTNMFRLAFSSDAIYQNGVSGICAVKNVKLWQNDELIDADATGAELSSVYDCSDFVPSNVCVAVDQDSGRFIEPSMTTDGKLSSLRFVFDVTNGTDATIGYDVAAVLMGTNSALVASVNTPIYVTNGVNQIELSIPASDIAASGEDGPYRFESIELQPQGDSTCGTTYRPNVLSGVYGANDFGGATVEACDSVRLIETSDYDVLTFEYSYNAFRVGRVIVEIVLTDRNGDLATNVITTNEVSEIGVKTNVISIARCDLAENNAGVPYAVASLFLRPDISGEEPVYADTVSLTNILWMVAPPVFSPVTKTVFFSCSQPVVISCATPGAEIRYTLDGTEPTESSLLYEGALTITNSVTVKARAFAEYMRPSEIVQAEYIHAAIVGGNLVQIDTLNVDEAQMLNIPAPGAYKASFDYSQGGDVELRLVGNGTTNTLAVISAASAGSTNFLFEVAEAGKYELSIYDLSLGVAQPADVSSLSICIPDTGRNRSRYWIYETEDTFGSTGEWVTESGFVNGKMPVNGSSVFTAAQQSFGRNVTILTTVEFDSIVDRDAYADELEGVKVGITLGRREDGAPSFLVLSSENGQKVWLNVSGAGLPEPIPETPYTVKLTFDCTNRTFEVSLVERGGHETPLTYGTTNCFSYAENTDAAIYQVGYNGCGNILSLHGVDDYPEASFMQGDALSLNGSQTPAITEGEAAWLNSMNAYDVVKSKVASMSRQDIEEAYLLNLDITKDVFGLDVFKVSGIEVTETEIKIHVWLNRTNAIQASHAGEKRDAPINGILKLYGGSTPQTKELLNATMIIDADFSDGDTATIVYPRSGNAKFFRTVIGTRTE